jgi:hypothetical protein
MDTDAADIGDTAATTDMVAIMDTAATTVTADTVTVTLIAADMAAGAATSHMAARFTNAEADSEAVMALTAAEADSTATAEPDFMAPEAVASTVQVVAGFTVVVEAMEADTGN